MVFKLFPEHLDRDLIKRELFCRNDIAFIVLRRRPIESFISDCKAGILNNYLAVDTTELKPVLAVEPFLQWAEMARSWYDWSAQEIAAAGHPRVDLSYDRQFVASSDDQALAILLDSLQRFGLPKPEITFHFAGLQRQDREAAYKGRVANWPQFEAALRADAASGALLDWAETTP
jgi:hypothetical protein